MSLCQKGVDVAMLYLSFWRNKGIVPRDVEIAEAAAALERLCSLCGLGKMII
jgi:hypothetical protein